MSLNWEDNSDIEARYTIEQWNAAAVKELPLEMPMEYLRKHGVYTPPGEPKLRPAPGAARALIPAASPSTLRNTG